MSLQSFSEELLVVGPHDVEESPVLEVLEVFSPGKESEHSHEKHHSHEHQHAHEHSDHADSDKPLEIKFVIEDIPGAPPGTKDPEPAPAPAIEVHEESEPEDENELKSKKKNEKWDWASKGAEGFISWVHEKIQSCPKHSGYDSAGLERAISYLEKLDSEISKAMRLDLDGELDANKIEEVRAQIDNGVNKLNDRLDKVTKDKKKKKKKSSYEHTFVKQAGTPGVHGVIVTAPLFISMIARICINGLVSAGHDIEETFKEQSKKYKLTDRERAETVQLLMDMGYNLFQDRGRLEEETDLTSSDNFDFSAQWQA